MYNCINWLRLRPRNPPPPHPTHLGSYTWALLVSQDRRHLFVRCDPMDKWTIKTPNPIGGFIKGILRGVGCTKSLRVLFLHRRPPSWTTLVLYSRAVFIFNEPAYVGFSLSWPANRLCGMRQILKTGDTFTHCWYFDPACELLPPWTKEQCLCTVAPLPSLLPPSPSPLPKLNVQYIVRSARTMSPAHPV